MFCFSLSCKAQKMRPSLLTIPIENYIDYQDNNIPISENTYFKDVNNLLNKYVGTWVGIYENKTYELHVNKYIYESDIRPPLRFDELLIRYKITDANGNIIENTLNLPDDSPYVISGKYLSANEAYYVLGYVGQEGECGQMGDVFIEVPTNSGLTEMKMFMVPDNEIILGYECPNGPANQILPLDKMILLKQ